MSEKSDETTLDDSAQRRPKGFLKGVLSTWRSTTQQSSIKKGDSHSSSCDHIAEAQGGSIDSPLLSVPESGLLEKAASTEGRIDLGLEESSSIPGSESPYFHPCPTIPVKPGFLPNPTAIAYDPIQRLIAIGNRDGTVKIFPFRTCKNDQTTDNVNLSSCIGRHTSPVLQLFFVINEGLLLSRTEDDAIHLWNYKSSPPEIVNSIKFQGERLSAIHFPFQSKWFYIGTVKGNVHVVNLDSFQLSGYIIYWNKAIDLSQRTHPGGVIHLSDSPIDQNKLLIGYESLIVLWDLKNKSADNRITCHPLTSICWHHEGRHFVASHTDGSFTTWEIKATRPSSVLFPHATTVIESKIEPCQPIRKIEVKTCRSDEPFTVFAGGHPLGSQDIPSNPDSPCHTTHLLVPQTSSGSGGSPASSSNLDLSSTASPNQTLSSTTVPSSSLTSLNKKDPSLDNNQSPHQSHRYRYDLPKSLSIIHGKTTSVLEMPNGGQIIDFLTLSETPYACDFSDPYGVLVLLNSDVVFVDFSGRKGAQTTDFDDGPRYSTSSILLPPESDSAGEPLFSSKEIPDPPKQEGFFMGLLATSSPPVLLDREELFGEQGSGKAPRTIAKQIPGSGGGLDQSKLQAGGLMSDVMKARQGLTERGEHLERLEDRTAQMANEAGDFRQKSAQLLNKYMDKKWYQF